MRTQNKENYYYWFWIVAMIAFIVPQVFTAWAYLNIVSILKGWTFNMNKDDLMHLKIQAAMRENNIPETEIKYIGEGEGTH